MVAKILGFRLAHDATTRIRGTQNRVYRTFFFLFLFFRANKTVNNENFLKNKRKKIAVTRGIHNMKIYRKVQKSGFFFKFVYIHYNTRVYRYNIIHIKSQVLNSKTSNGPRRDFRGIVKNVYYHTVLFRTELTEFYSSYSEANPQGAKPNKS